MAVPAREMDNPLESEIQRNIILCETLGSSALNGYFLERSQCKFVRLQFYLDLEPTLLQVSLKLTQVLRILVK